MRKIIIAAVDKNGVIGKEGTVPWYSKEEMKHFKSVTTGHPVIMGRRTFDSLPKPLSNRLNIIISRNPKPGLLSDDVRIFTNLNDAYSYCSDVRKDDEVYIIGGGEIFMAAIHHADTLLISYMKFEAEGDIYFPDIVPEVWEEKSREIFLDYELVEYTRKNIF